jgi:hypothetical protein
MVDNIAHHKKINHSNDKPQKAMVDNIAHHNNINHSSDKPQIAMVDNIAHHNNISHWSGLFFYGGLYCLPLLFEVCQRSDLCWYVGA